MSEHQSHKSQPMCKHKEGDVWKDGCCTDSTPNENSDHDLFSKQAEVTVMSKAKSLAVK